MTRSTHRYPEQLHPDSPRGHVARSPIRTPLGRSTRYLWTSHPDDNISYPDMLFRSLTSAAIWWCVRTPCPDLFCSLHSGSDYGKGLQSFGSLCFWAFHCFAMDSKELSSFSDCFGDQKAIKTPKLNTIWLELIARVLNMLIGLKGDNYYSKVFIRLNYRLSNNTFWVVIKGPCSVMVNDAQGFFTKVDISLWFGNLGIIVIMHRKPCCFM